MRRLWLFLLLLSVCPTLAWAQTNDPNIQVTLDSASVHFAVEGGQYVITANGAGLQNAAIYRSAPRAVFIVSAILGCAAINGCAQVVVATAPMDAFPYPGWCQTFAQYGGCQAPASYEALTGDSWGHAPTINEMYGLRGHPINLNPLPSGVYTIGIWLGGPLGVSLSNEVMFFL